MLRRVFRISAHEAEHVIPAWEREMLLRLYMETAGGEGSAADTTADPFAAVPDELRDL